MVLRVPSFKQLAASATILIVACSLGCRNKTLQPTAVAELSEGDYLSTNYIEQLRKTRSPYKAGDQRPISLVIVHRQGTDLLIDTSYNFHEGGEVLRVAANGQIEPSSGENVKQLTGTVLNEHSLRFGINDNPVTTYEHVGNAATYVARASLVGTYQNSRGRTYEFRNDGTAVFPDHTFRYEVGLDHVFGNFDYFDEKASVNGNSRTWAFRWEGDDLDLFATREIESGVDEISDTRPRLILHRSN